MTDNNMLNDEVMKFVSGGQLSEGWEKTILRMMAIFKGEYGDDGCEKIKALMSTAIFDPTSTIEASDLQIIYRFIDENWSTVVPENIIPFPGME